MKASKQPLLRFYAFYDTVLSKPFISLLQRLRSDDERIMILAKTTDYLRLVDQYLWSYEETSFMPHSLEKNQNAPNQPIWLSIDPFNVNNAHHLVILEGASDYQRDHFDTVTELFSKKDHRHLENAQERYKKSLNLKYKTQYYSQSETGKWSGL